MKPNQRFIIDSYHFYKIALDSYERAKKRYKRHMQKDALVSIVFSAFSLEAFINELLAFAKMGKNAGLKEDFLDKLIEAIDESSSSQTSGGKGKRWKSTLEKFMLASEALGSKFDKGKAPYQDFADLFRLRDCLAHLKPEDLIEYDKDEPLAFRYLGRKLTEKFRGKGILREATTIESITFLVSTAKAAKWACETASKMVNAMLDKIPESDFKNYGTFLAYRGLFPPPTHLNTQNSVKNAQAIFRDCVSPDRKLSEELIQERRGKASCDKKVVVDASAVLALLNEEDGSEEISQLIGNAVISSVNLSEVVTKLADAGITERNIEQILSNLNLEIIPFNNQQAFMAALLLRPSTKLNELSLGDRACLALGIALNLPVITTDRLWANLNLDVEIRVVR